MGEAKKWKGQKKSSPKIESTFKKGLKMEGLQRNPKLNKEMRNQKNGVTGW